MLIEEEVVSHHHQLDPLLLLQLHHLDPLLLHHLHLLDVAADPHQ
jgi:hypothetical protein